MTDIKTIEERSRNMAAIKGKNTKPEQYICHELYHRGFRYRKNVNYVTGHPDIYLAKYNTAIFVNGCFWHRHEGCKYSYTPKSRIDFWREKFEANVARDSKVRRELENQGIKVVVIWECTIKKMKHDSGYNEQILNEIEKYFSSEKLMLEL